MVQEARAKDMISQLKLEMNNLTRLVEAGAGLSIGEESTMNELLKQKEDLTRERDAQVSLTASMLHLCAKLQTCQEPDWLETVDCSFAYLAGATEPASL